MDAAWERRRLEIFDALDGVDDPEREEVLRRLCGDDAILRRGVEELLQSDRGTHDLDTPFASAAQVLAEAEDPLPLGTRLGPYRIEQRIGSGGMGVVYRARHDDLGLVVAIKVLHGGPLRRSQLGRLRQEGKILARLQHPGIARIFDVGVHREQGASLAIVVPYLVMELIDGKSLLLSCRQLALAQRLALMVKVCAAVQAGHERGIVHRDLKPENVLVDASGQPKVIDFGIASLGPQASASLTRLTDVLPGVGTLPYMSPEQLRGADVVDTKGDVYALGVLLYQLITDRLPFEIDGKPTHEDIQRICTEMPRPPSSVRPGVPRELDWIVAKALAIDPSERYLSAGLIADDLQKLAADLPVSAMPPNRWRELQRVLRRRRGLMYAAFAVTVTLLAGLVGTLAYAGHASSEAARAAAALGAMRSTSDLVVAKLNEAMLWPGPELRRLREDLLTHILAPLATAQQQASVAWPTQQAVAALITLTELALAKGDLELAARTSESALTAARSMLAAEIEAPGLLALVGAAQCNQATVAIHRGKAGDAETGCREAIAACEQAAALGSVAGKQWLVKSRGKLAGVVGGQGLQDESLALREAAVALQRELWASKECKASDLAEVLIALALARNSRGAPGESDLLREVVTLHAAQPVAPFDPTAAGQVAHATQRLAEVLIADGEIGPGLEFLEGALDVRGRLHAADPDDGRLARAYVVCLRAACFANRRVPRYEVSLTAAETASGIARKLAEKSTTDAEARGLLAQALADEAEARRLLKRDGTHLLAEAVTIVRELHDSDPQAKYESGLATMSRMLAEALRVQGRNPAAFMHATTATEMRRSLLARNPDDMEERSRLTGALRTLGRVQLELADWGAARATFVAAGAELADLRRLQPENDGHRQGLVYVALQLGYVECEADRNAEARAHFATACALCRERLERAPGDFQASATLGQALHGLGSTQDNDSDSIPIYEEALQLRLRFEAQGQRSVSMRSELAHAFAMVARACIRTQQYERAAECLREAITRHETPDGIPSRDRARFESALAGLAWLPTLATVGDVGTAAIADCLMLAHWPERAMPCFEQALARGDSRTDVELRFRAAVAAAHASRRVAAVGDRALDLLRACVGAWRERLAECERTAATTSPVPAALVAERDALAERLRQVRAEEFAFLPLRARPEWAEIFPEGGR